MKPLSIIKFIRGCGIKILPLTITVALAVALLYFLGIMENQLLSSNKDVNISYLINMSIVAGDNEGFEPQALNLLKSSNSIEKLYPAAIWKVNHNSVGGSTAPLLMMKNEDLKAALQYQKWSLIEGRLPEKPLEIILDKKLALNNKLKVGQIMKMGTRGWQIGGDVKIVGIFDGSVLLGLGFSPASGMTLEKPGVSIITFTAESKVSAMNDLIEKEFGDKYEVFTYQRAQKTMADIIKAFNTITFIIGLVVVVAICALLGNINMIQYSQRSKEFQMLHAIGFTKRNIVLKIAKELSFTSIIGYGTGVFIGAFGGWLLNVCVLDEKAMSVELFQIDKILWVLLVPVLVTIFGMLSPIKIINFEESM